ncbi:DNA repair protein RecO [Desulfuromonas acetoxidans]|uniref:DNA repair protein RecO n=1 Tax=Desulfuromonas acetoxidans (strain DSM 684 / 11070) TaxID=281689 RepID=Q1K048_DESA6|nr:DNA repair protein RecO [Desulfuromonas acetoxidans]EAT15694.1 DNA repair protein RecO [Desulfuromonas acetoxidans DSM 684]MBF0646955.1 DNA repair protein RecO [Desulfuromonas acetoxidans]NVD26036.1 DNA repair protein RecO [Desulfuromonas acetoxidans]NVE16948.1 DNA repair protein RecO [Desulfuromonas acetoxidans]
MDGSPCEAIVLRCTDYGEADRIVTLLTRDHGICGAFARNARSSRRRFGGALHPFSRLRITWQTRRRGGLPQLAEVELLDGAHGLMTNLDGMALAAYGCELIMALWPEEQAIPEVYDLLRSFLPAAASSGAGETLRLLMELRLLDAAGLLPHLGHCGECWAVLGAGEYRFDAARGGTLCAACAYGHHGGVVVDALTLGSLVRLLQVDPLVFEGIRLSPLTVTQAGELLHHCVEETVGRPLKSERFLASLKGV